MAKSVNIADLKNRLSHHLNAVRRGRELLVCDRRTPIARVVPIETGASEDDELLALAAGGKLRLGAAFDESFWDMPAPRVRADVLRRVIRQERDDTR